jgi:hypothetical protein
MGYSCAKRIAISVLPLAVGPIKKIAGGNFNTEWLMGMYHHKK